MFQEGSGETYQVNIFHKSDFKYYLMDDVTVMMLFSGAAERAGGGHTGGGCEEGGAYSQGIVSLAASVSIGQVDC